MGTYDHSLTDQNSFMYPSVPRKNESLHSSQVSGTSSFGTRSSSLYIPMETSITLETSTWPFGRPSLEPSTHSNQLDSEFPDDIINKFQFGRPGCLEDSLSDGESMNAPPVHRPYSPYPVNHPSHKVKGASIHYSPRPSVRASIATTMDSPTAWLIMYFAFNLGLTLYNKLVLQGFPFPWTFTAVHMFSGIIGSQTALNQGYFTPATLNSKENITMLLFSVLYTINIAVSNLSLHLVTVPLHQVLRALTPLFVLIITTILYAKHHSQATYLSLVPVVAGVVFATYGDYGWTPWGLFLTLLGTLLAAIKTVATNRILVGKLKVHPLDLLMRMSPLAFIQCVIFAWMTGELQRVSEYGATKMTNGKLLALAVNGAIAFGLNVVSFTANKKTSALTMTVAANVKQVLTIVLAVIIFSLQLNFMNVFGITLTLMGGAWYARVEMMEKSKSTNPLLRDQKRGMS